MSLSFVYTKVYIPQHYSPEVPKASLLLGRRQGCRCYLRCTGWEDCATDIA
ncbi:MAG: hypothetical protein N2517_08265 [Ignavibacteria bacterium]|nr:hypothetical protein [Ignavibacteria bacterium]